MATIPSVNSIEPLSETAFPVFNGVSNKYLCRDIKGIIQPNDGDDIMALSIGQSGNKDYRTCYDKATTDSSTYDEIGGGNDDIYKTMTDEYGREFTSLIKEVQQSSDITNKITPSITKEIYVKINDLISNVYKMNNVIKEGFEEVVFADSRTDMSIVDSAISSNIKELYTKNFSGDEAINIFELQTPMKSGIILDKDKDKFFTDPTDYIFASDGIDNRKILFSSHRNPDANFDGKKLVDILDEGNDSNTLIDGKGMAEYARNFTMEMTIHSQLIALLDGTNEYETGRKQVDPFNQAQTILTSLAKNLFDENGNMKDDKELISIPHTTRLDPNVSSGFFVTRDRGNNINGVIFYYALIIPRPYTGHEMKRLSDAIRDGDDTYLNIFKRLINDSIHHRNQLLDIYCQTAVEPELRYNPNCREQYIAISSSINFLHLIQYYPFRDSIVSTNVLTILANTFNTLNDVSGYQFTDEDMKWEYGLPHEYDNLQCLVSSEYPNWVGKKITECLLPYSNINYPKYIFDIINTIYTQYGYDNIVNNQKILLCKELGNDKLIITINMIKIQDIGGNFSISFQMKELQYNNLFPVRGINADTEISGELIIKKSTGEQIMNIDPITNTSIFFTKVGINQSSYEVDGLLDINNLSKKKVETLINSLKIINKKSNSIGNGVVSGRLENTEVEEISNVSTNQTLFQIPLKQYESIAPEPLYIDRSIRMNKLTAQLEVPFVQIAIQRTKVKMAEAEAKIIINNNILDDLWEEYDHQKNMEVVVTVSRIALFVLLSVIGVAAGVGGAAIIGKVVVETLLIAADEIPWDELSKVERDLIQKAGAGIDPDDFDGAVDIVEYLISVCKARIGEIELEYDVLKTELDTLNTTLQLYIETNEEDNDAGKKISKDNGSIINSNNVDISNNSYQITVLSKEMKELIYIQKNEHTYENWNEDGTIVRTIESGIIMNDPSFTIIADPSYNTTPMLLTETTTIFQFFLYYINLLPKTITDINNGREISLNKRYNILLQMYLYAYSTIGYNVFTKSVLTYINDVYIPIKRYFLNYFNTQIKNANKQSLTIVFTEQKKDTILIDDLKSNITILEGEVQDLQVQINALESVKTWAQVIKNSGMGDQRFLDNHQYGYYIVNHQLPEYKYLHTNRERIFGQQNKYDGKLGYAVKAQPWARSIFTNGVYKFSDEITEAMNIRNEKQKQIDNKRLELNVLQQDELQNLTNLYSFTTETHNKLKHIINNISQIYLNSKYAAKGSLETYTILVNLVDNDSSKTHVLNINILEYPEKEGANIVVTSSALNTNLYTVDLSYRDKFNEIVNELSGVYQLINYITIIFKTDYQYLISQETTIEKQMNIDNLFTSRFNCKAYTTIDNISDGKIVNDELQPERNNKLFNEIGIVGTNLTLEDVYADIDIIFKKNYGKYIFDRNYMIEYKINNVLYVYVLRYIKLIINDELKVFRVICSINVDSFLNKGLLVDGDSSFYGDFMVKRIKEDEPIFHIDSTNNNIINMSNVGIKKNNPSVALDINDTNMPDIVKMDMITSKQTFLINLIANNIGTKTKAQFITYLKTNIDNYIDSEGDKSKFICYKLPQLNSNNKIQAEELEIIYGPNEDWVNQTYTSIMMNFPGFENQIVNNVLPPIQNVLDNYLLYNGAIYTINTEYDDKTTKGYYMIFEWRGNLHMIGSSGYNIEDYNITLDGVSKADNMVKYSDKQLRFMNSVKKLKSNKLIDDSGNEINVHNVSENDVQIDIDINTHPSIVDDIDVYFTGSESSTILDIKVNSITNIRTDDQKDIYYNILLESVSGEKITNTISDMSFDNERERHVAFLSALTKQYGTNLQDFKDSVKKYDCGIVLYNNQHDYYRSIYYIIKKERTDIDTEIKTIDINIYSFYMKYNNYITTTLNAHGDVSIDGGLTLWDNLNDTRYLTVSPHNKYVGINTDNRFINYIDTYNTTTSLYNTPHNLVVYNNKYPNAVFERKAETVIDSSSTNLDYTTFGSFSGLTVQRSSDLYTFDASLIELVNLNNNKNGWIDNANDSMNGSNWNNYKHYGSDISFELKNRNGITKELGQLKMVIDDIDDSGNLKTGFGVQVIDNTIVDASSIEYKVKNLMYVNSNSQLFVDGVMLGGHLLKVDASNNLVWGNHIVATNDQASV